MEEHATYATIAGGRGGGQATYGAILTAAGRGWRF